MDSPENSNQIEPIYLSRLHQLLVQYYSLEELKTLCFYLGIEYENLAGPETRNTKAREIILYVGRNNEIRKLLDALLNPAVGRIHAFVDKELPVEDLERLTNRFREELIPFEIQTKPLHQRLLTYIHSHLKLNLGLSILILVGLIALTRWVYIMNLPDCDWKKPFHVAVAGFIVEGEPNESPFDGEDVATYIVSSLSELEGTNIAVLGPECAGSVAGYTEGEQDDKASEIARKLKAHIVVYGAINFDTDELSPKFYVNYTSFYQAAEITGPHQLGYPLRITGDSIFDTDKLSIRTQSLVHITTGLSYYVNHEYRIAFERFQLAQNTSGWNDDEGKYVLYLLMGNAAGKEHDLANAKENYEHSLQLNPEYARAYIGLGSVYYQQAVKSIENAAASNLDREALDQAIAYYQRALVAQDAPPLADVPPKVHFGLGQSYILQALQFYETEKCFDVELDFGLAVTEFNLVIIAYGTAENVNPRIQELAAEAYGRLGLIYKLSCQNALALEAYQMAAQLSVDAERKDAYQDRINELHSTE